jgi:hypothetical protein
MSNMKNKLKCQSPKLKMRKTQMSKLKVQNLKFGSCIVALAFGNLALGFNFVGI